MPPSPGGRTATRSQPVPPSERQSPGSPRASDDPLARPSGTGSVAVLRHRHCHHRRRQRRHRRRRPPAAATAAAPRRRGGERAAQRSRDTSHRRARTPPRIRGTNRRAPRAVPRCRPRSLLPLARSSSGHVREVAEAMGMAAAGAEPLHCQRDRSRSRSRGSGSSRRCSPPVGTRPPRRQRTPCVVERREPVVAPRRLTAGGALPADDAARHDSPVLNP